MVVAQQSVELKRVELEAGVVDVRHVLHGVFVHREKCCCLERQKGNNVDTLVMSQRSTCLFYDLMLFRK